jgi:WD40 repeat protein
VSLKPLSFERIPAGHESRVLRGAWATDGRITVTADDTTVIVRDLRTGKVLHTQPGHPANITSLHVHDGRIASGCENGTVTTRDANTGQPLLTLTGHDGPVVSVHLSGSHIASGGEDKTVHVWSLEKGALLHVLEGHAKPVTSVSISDGRIVSQGCEETIILWDLETGAMLDPLERVQDHTGSCMHVNDGCVVSGGELQTIRVWSLKTGELLRVWPGQGATSEAVHVAEGRVLVGLGSYDLRTFRFLRVYDLATGELLREITDLGDNVNVLHMSGGHILSCGKCGTIRLWELERGVQLVHTLETDTDDIFSVHGYNSGYFHDHRMVSVGRDKTVRVWSVKTGRLELVHTLHGHTDEVLSVTVCGYNRHIYSGSEDGTIRVWELDTGRHVHTLHMPRDIQVDSVHVYDGRIVSACVYEVHTWDFKTYQELLTLDHKAPIWSTDVSDGCIVSGCLNDTIYVWDLKTGAPLHKLTGHAKPPTALSVANGLVVSASDDHTALVWDLKTGELLHTLRHPAEVGAVHTSKELVVTGCHDKAVRTWDVKTGKVLSTLEAHPDHIHSVHMTQGCIVMVSEAVRVWFVQHGTTALDILNTFQTRARPEHRYFVDIKHTLLMERARFDGKASARVVLLEAVRLLYKAHKDKVRYGACCKSTPRYGTQPRTVEHLPGQLT